MRLAQQNGSRTDYFLPDALGSVRQLATQDGNIGLTQSFDPFGNPFSAMGPGASSYGYAGEWADATELQFLRARYYSPGQGRFLSHDPFPGLLEQPATLNPYVYVFNNPLLYTDPSGEFVFLPLIAVALAGGVIGGLGYYAIQTYLSGDPCARWNLTEAALWGGAGAVIGAVMGGGIYGGWWVGTQFGWWGGVSTGSYTVYWYIENDVPRYIGQTSNYLLRAKTHFEMRGWIIKPIKGLRHMSQFDARAVEQVLIEHYGLENLNNKIYSIAPNNAIYQDAINRGMEILFRIGFFK
jgi:RHS repeat-associated protein